MKKLLIIAFLIVCNSAKGINYYVSPAGSDLNLGSENHPFASITYAETIAAPGDSVVVLSGIYYESVHVRKSGTAGMPITYLAPPGKDVTIKAQVDYCFLIADSVEYIVIDGFNMTNAKWVLTAHGAGVRIFGSNCTVRNCHFYDNEMGVLIEPFSFDTVNVNHHNRIEGSIFSDSEEAAIRIKRSDDNAVVNNLIYHNGYTGEPKGSISYYGVHRIEILNNTLWDNAGPAIHSYDGTNPVMTPVCVDVVVTNNIAVNFFGQPVFMVDSRMIDVDSNTYMHNLWYNGYPGSPLIVWGNNNYGEGGDTLTFTEYLAIASTVNPLNGTGSLDADPLFEDAYNNMLDLLANSPALDAGTLTLSELGLTGLTCRSDQSIDTGIPDLGYHHLPGGYSPNLSVVYQPVWRIFPNPASEVMHFSIKLPLSANRILPVVQVYNVLGQLVTKIITASDSPNNDFQLEWTIPPHQASGVYIVRLSTHAKTVVEKVVVVK